MTKAAYDKVCAQATELVRNAHGMIRTAELSEAGIAYKTVLAMVADGTLVRAKSGYYSLPDADFSEEEMLAAQFPDGVLTMQSALYIYGYLKEKPASWHIAISKNTSKSRFKSKTPPTIPYYTEERVLPIGAVPFTIGGGQMRIYEKDRLICDVLKYEEKLEREDFKSALLRYIEDDGKDAAKLLMYARERKVLKRVQTMIGVWL